MSTLTPDLSSVAEGILIGGGTWLHADVTVPPNAMGVVVFAHGSGSGRHSPRNRYVASQLNLLQLATVLADLLTEAEERVDDRSGALRFDISLLAHRVEQIVDWAQTHGALATLPIGLFGASTGAAAALDAAASRPQAVRAVVSRGGRPDLATHLDAVKAPTLLIVGGHDTEVLDLNRGALRRLSCRKELVVIPGATHLFEERGTLEAAASAAGTWFHEYLAQTPARQL